MDKLTWVHISDLHISHGHMRKSGTQIPLESLAIDILGVLKDIDTSASFVAITGDLVERPESEAYINFTSFLKNLLIKLSLETQNVYIVPGNTDFLKKGRFIIKPWIGPTRSTAFKDFVKSFYGDSLRGHHKNGVYIWKATYAGRRIGIAGIDTLFEANIENTFHPNPLISDSQMLYAIQGVEDSDIRIALLHHSPEAFSSRIPEIAGALFQNFDFILHGHGHNPSVRVIVSPDSQAMTIGAGAIGGYAASKYAYNVVSINFKDNTGKSYFRIFNDAEKRWVADSFTYRNARDGIYRFLLSSRIAPELLPDEADAPTETHDKVTILHLSDLQFGRHHVVEDRPLLYENNGDYTVEIEKICADIRRVKKAYELNVDFIAVTGDIAEWSLADEYGSASAFLNGIISELELSPHQVIIVPGNHDVNWKLCEAERLRCEAYNIDFTPPYFAKFEFYKQFIDEFYGDSAAAPPFEVKFTDELFTIHPFSEKGIVFIGLNSAVRESEKDNDHYGYVSVDQLRRALKSCERLPQSEHLLRIVLVHHNYRRDSTYDNENLRDADDLETLLLNGGVKLLLHGHQHVPKSTALGVGNKVMHVISTGSAGLDSETIPENARRYQYTVIEGKQVRVYRRRYEKHQRDETGLGCWVPDPLPEDSPLQPIGNETYSFNLED